MRKSLFVISMLAAVAGMPAAAVEYPGAAPGKAQAEVRGTTYTVGNEVLSADFEYKNGAVTFGGLRATDGTQLVQGGAPVFNIVLADKTKLSSSNMTVAAPQVVEPHP